MTPAGIEEQGDPRLVAEALSEGLKWIARAQRGRTVRGGFLPAEPLTLCCQGIEEPPG